MRSLALLALLLASPALAEKQNPDGPVGAVGITPSLYHSWAERPDVEISVPGFPEIEDQGFGYFNERVNRLGIGLTVPVAQWMTLRGSFFATKWWRETTERVPVFDQFGNELYSATLSTDQEQSSKAVAISATFWLIPSGGS